LVKADTVKPVGKSYKTPGGRMVYGGGGITPDVFVPYDTTRLDSTLYTMYYKSTMNNFVYRLYLQDQKRFTTYKTPEELATQFNPGEVEWQQLVSFAAKDSIRLNNVMAKDKTFLLKNIQLMMARQIWRTQGYYEVQNKTDKTVLRALEALK
jgi:carboxyl-terminal processing protease